MRERPPDLSDADVLAAVSRHWPVEVDAVEHLPVGFGAHHWRASLRGEPRLFVTLDAVGERHSAASLEAAYAAVAALELDVAIASLPTIGGDFTVALADGRLSSTPWTAGEVAGSGPLDDADLARENLDALARLHGSTPPAAIPRWRPRVQHDFPASLAASLGTPWATGPYGEPARAAISERLAAIAGWAARHHRLVETARTVEWVPTHGEPHSRNQLRTPAGLPFVDWESLALAPRERDLGPLLDAGYADHVRPDWSMVELFDLEWRLDEIAQYAAWFALPHTGNEDDRIAFDSLRCELDRPGR